MKSLLLVLSHIILISGTRVRLRSNDSSPHQGTVEVYHNGEWGTICDDSWTDNEASVICRMLNFSKGGKAFDRAHFGEGSGPILLDGVNCASDHTSDIWECDHRGLQNHNCNHNEDAGVVCRLSGTRLRLRGNGSSLHQGRVEVYHNGSWNTICGDYWGVHEATVICRMLNFSKGGESYSHAVFGEGNGPILPQDVMCFTDQINDISDCYTKSSFWLGCDHSKDAGVACTVSDCKSGSFGKYCSQKCRCIIPGCHHVTGVCDNAGCQAGWGGSSCDKGFTDVRLRGNASSPHRGRVEVYHNGEWGTICDDYWTDNEASVICRMLNYSKGGKAFGQERYGEDRRPILLDDVVCLSEHIGDISDCNHGGWGKHNCHHSEYAGVECRLFECETGTFGTNCLQRCHCKHPGCHFVTGVCNIAACKDGWEECERGAFGEDCSQRCHCKDPGCHHVTGVCNNVGCEDGWKGPSCDKECENGTFGTDCLRRCHCKIPGCHHVTGICNKEGCQEGWENSSCDKVTTTSGLAVILAITFGLLTVFGLFLFVLFKKRKRRNGYRQYSVPTHRDRLTRRRSTAVSSVPFDEDLELGIMTTRSPESEETIHLTETLSGWCTKLQIWTSSEESTENLSEMLDSFEDMSHNLETIMGLPEKFKNKRWPDESLDAFICMVETVKLLNTRLEEARDVSKLTPRPLLDRLTGLMSALEDVLETKAIIPEMVEISIATNAAARSDISMLLQRNEDLETDVNCLTKKPIERVRDLLLTKDSTSLNNVDVTTGDGKQIAREKGGKLNIIVSHDVSKTHRSYHLHFKEGDEWRRIPATNKNDRISVTVSLPSTTLICVTSTISRSVSIDTASAASPVSENVEFFSDKSMHFLVENITPDKVYALVICLGISDATYQNIKFDHQSSLHEFRLNLIKHWLHNEGSTNQQRVEKLCLALREIDMQYVAETVESVFKMNRSLQKADFQH